MLKHFIKNQLQATILQQFPSTCLLCAEIQVNHNLICHDCYQELPFMTNYCLGCGLSISEKTKICGTCINQPFSFQECHSVFNYNFAIPYLISQLKFHDQILIAKLFGKILCQKMLFYYRDNAQPEFIIPVPLHQKRLRQRGYNQTYEIAKFIKQNFSVKLTINACQRIKATKPQTELNKKQRHNNVINAFSITPNFQAKHIAILDDVMTTGHTVNELSKSFIAAGVEKIDIWLVARNSLHHEISSV